MQSRLLLLSVLISGAINFLVAADVEKIQCVESGLRAPIAIKDQPVARMAITERLKFYHVPGVSVVVIDFTKTER